MKRAVLKLFAAAFVGVCLCVLSPHLKAAAYKYPGGLYMFADVYSDDADINDHLYLSLDEKTHYTAQTVSESGYYPTGTVLHEEKDGVTTGKYIYILSGDVNCDGALDVLDINILELYLGGNHSLGVFAQAAADLDRNGTEDVADYARAVNLVLSNGKNYGELFADVDKNIASSKYSRAQINADKTLFAAGKTKDDYVTVKFNSTFTAATVSANGALSDGKTADYAAGKSPLALHAATLKTVNIENGITYIGENFFADCRALKSAALPPTCRDIGAKAFRNDSGLESIDLGRVRTVGTGAFADCCSVKQALVIPDSCVFIGNYAFAGINCDAMGYTSLLLGKNVEYIGTAAFQMCSGMANELVLPEKLSVIGDFAFNHCASFQNTVLNIPAGVKHIGGSQISHALHSSDKIPTHPLTPDNFKTARYTDSASHVFYAFATKTLESFAVDKANTEFKAVNGVLYSKNGERLLCIPKNYGEVFVMPEGVKTADEMSMAYITDLTLADSFEIESWENAPSTQINFQNTLTDALYLNAMTAQVRLKGINRNYREKDGCIYKKDGNNTLLHVTLTPGCTLNIDENCRAIDGAFMFDKRIAPNINAATVNIPAGLCSISQNFSTAYPDEGELDALNFYINNGTLTVKIAKGNKTYANAKDGTVIVK